ncbi:hypothetical protein GDO78_013720 [Eleutherodactylus coqui]|uniref:Uncharacterized protein n=1 Tax=Eleutherodactylus coqui TaxID=57060 RepID=A0A8J6BHQ2_ELECQ|nr:hypothetical protein GDO78_013720 [Eleutherodactylus coqui]
MKIPQKSLRPHGQNSRVTKGLNSVISLRSLFVRRSVLPSGCICCRPSLSRGSHGARIFQAVYRRITLGTRRSASLHNRGHLTPQGEPTRVCTKSVPRGRRSSWRPETSGGRRAG